MASQTEWANRALDKIGEKPVIELDNNTVQGALINRMWRQVLEAELRDHKWSFSIKRIQLAADVAVPAFGYGQQFQLPPDCLRVLSILNIDVGPDLSDYRGSPNQLYVIEGRKILYGRPAQGSPAPSNPMPLRYIAYIEDTTQWDSSFGDAFACRLATEIAERLTQSSDKRKLAWNEYQMALRRAIRSNAIELPSDYTADDSWVYSRLRS
jgi:hypothetical protein